MFRKIIVILSHFTDSICSAFRPSASLEQKYFAYKADFVCKIPLLARTPGLNAAARLSARATIGYLV